VTLRTYIMMILVAHVGTYDMHVLTVLIRTRSTLLARQLGEMTKATQLKFS